MPAKTDHAIYFHIYLQCVLLFVLQRYIDPRNVHHAEKEALTLLATADSNQDGVLTLPEVLAQSHIFMASKMVDAARSFHDEF